MSFVEILGELDLSKNEAEIYESLVDKGESGVADIARESGVNRRNVYDALDRLLEKGLVFEIRQAKESRYKAVHPRKLREILKEKEKKLDSILTELEYMYNEKPLEEEVYIYRGIEGWKNYLALMLEVNDNTYVIGGKGIFADEKVVGYTQAALERLRERGYKDFVLYDHVVKKQNRSVLKLVESGEYRFLPENYDTPSTISISGDYVVIFADLSDGKLDEKSSFTVIKNKPIADSFRTWFKILWDQCEEVKSSDTVLA